MNRSYLTGGAAAAAAVAGLVVALVPHHASAPAPAAAQTVVAVPGSSSAAVGALRITDVYVPQPANGAVVAAYFTVTNTGAADSLVKVSSTLSPDTGLHDEVESGGVGTMVPLASLPIPAGATVSLSPAERHVMIENVTTKLPVGATVPLTLTFAHAGTITLKAPVVPLSATFG